MSDERKHILLISYVFPPHYGIGGRRWAKHANELTKLGYTVHVIHSKNPFNKNSIWTDLVLNNPNIIRHELSTKYPRVLVNFDNRIIYKIYYKLLILILPLFTKGATLDRTVFWKKTMLKKARFVISEYNIKHVICTGGPFGSMYYTTLLKRWFNDLFIINDLRDPWTWGPNWGFPNLNKDRLDFEKLSEYKTLRDSDIISAPTESLTNYLQNKYPVFKDKVVLLPHFYDPEELFTDTKTNSDVIRLILYGNIYQNIENRIELLAKILEKHKKKIVLDVYTDKTNHFQTFIMEGATNVNFHLPLPAKELFAKFKNYDYVLLVHPDYGKDNISTKFYEIIYTKTPIIIFSTPGKGSEFITENNLGIHVDFTNIEHVFESLSKHELEFKYNNNFNISEYSIEKIGFKLSEILKRGQSFISHKTNKLSRNVLLTFDYELFLGTNSGSVENCMIKPTNLIIEIFRNYQIKNAIFFVDTTYLCKLKERTEKKAIEDYKKILNQLILLLQEGHLIFPHLHPHWINAKYDIENNNWDLGNQSKYRFANISQIEKENLFESSINILKEIQNISGIHYPIDCYRAGGWCIQPFDDFKPFFNKYGIKHDFSVIKGYKMQNENFYYDFDSMPVKNIYNFNSIIDTEEQNGDYTEFSITSIHITGLKKTFNKLLLRVLFRLGYKKFGDGVSTIKHQETVNIESSENIFFTEKEIEMISIELMTIIKLKNYCCNLQYNNYIHFISHPKMFSKHNLYCFKRYLKYLKKNYKLETHYKQMINE